MPRWMLGYVLTFSFLAGALAECFAFFALVVETPPRMEWMISPFLLMALVYSVITAAIAMVRAVLGFEEDDEEAAPRG